MHYAHLIGTGSCMPKRILSNNDLENIVDTNDEWIMRRSGIKERRISSKDEDENTAELATRASTEALKMSGIPPEDLDLIVMGTVTPDRQFPSAACMVQDSLNASNATAFDVSAGCTGFLYSLSVVNNAIKVGTCKNGLVIGAERLSTIVNWKDRTTAVLLADGAGAVVITSKTSNNGIRSIHLKSDGKFWDLLYSSYGNTYLPDILADIELKPFHLKMEGNRLFKHAVSCMSDIARKALEYNKLTNENIDIVVPHQANIRIIDAVASNLNIPMEKVYTNLDKYGNTSSASIPIALDEANRSGRLKKGNTVLLASFGAGLTWGSSVITWSI